MEIIRPHKWSDGITVTRSVSWLYLISANVLGVLGQCRIASHSDPRECTLLRFRLSTGNFIHEMYFKISSYHRDMAMLPQSSVGQMDREIQTRPPPERQSQLP